MSKAIEFDSSQLRIHAIVLGAGSGAGERFARALAKRGVALLIADTDEISLFRLRNDIGAASAHCDVLSEPSVEALFDRGFDLFGNVDLLVNAAGRGYVRTLGVMRASRDFARRPRSGPALIANIAANPDETEGPITYAGSERAFERLSRGIAQSIEGPAVRIMTFERLSSAAAIDDIAEQLCREVGRDALQPPLTSDPPAPAAE